MSMTTDSDHQALDMNIGRIVEMYFLAEIELPEAKSDLMTLFGGPHPASISDALKVYLSRMLVQTRQGDLDAGEVRVDLVRLAGLAHAHDPDFIARIRQDQA